jgi:hypothetical protein
MPKAKAAFDFDHKKSLTLTFDDVKQALAEWLHLNKKLSIAEAEALQLVPAYTTPSNDFDDAELIGVHLSVDMEKVA